MYAPSIFCGMEMALGPQRTAANAAFEVSVAEASATAAITDVRLNRDFWFFIVYPSCMYVSLERVKGLPVQVAERLDP
jgi:hypothetical protein